MSAYWLLLPLTAALILKAMVLIVARRAAVKTDFLWAFIATFAVHNLTELLAFYDATDGIGNIYLYKAYYSITFVLLAYACSMGVEIGGARKIRVFAVLERTVWAASLLGVVLSLFTTQVVAGLNSLGYIYTAVRGDYYGLFYATSVLALLVGLGGICIGFLAGNDARQKQRSAMSLAAFVPIVLAALSVLGAMSVGIKVNALAVLPLGSALFLVILVYSESRHGLTDIRKVVPGSRQKQTISRISELFSEYALGNTDYYPAIDEIEKLLVAYAHDKHEGNILQTAKHMGLSRSTLYKKMSKHKIGKAHNKSTEPNPAAPVDASQV